MSSSEVIHFTKFQDLTYLDNLALFYVCNETPPVTLALAKRLATKFSGRF